MKTLSEAILDLTIDPNLIGEILRDKFFKQDKEKTGKFGCYSTFELNKDVIELSEEKNLDYGFKNVGVIVTCAKLEDIIMKYFWEHDGDLSFYFPNGRVLNNDDAKKDCNWKWLN